MRVLERSIGRIIKNFAVFRMINKLPACETRRNISVFKNSAIHPVRKEPISATILTKYLLKLHFNITLVSKLIFSTNPQMFHVFLISPVFTTYPTRLMFDYSLPLTTWKLKEPPNVVFSISCCFPSLRHVKCCPRRFVLKWLHSIDLCIHHYIMQVW